MYLLGSDQGFNVYRTSQCGFKGVVNNDGDTMAGFN